MGIRTKTNHRLQHTKSLNALKKAGLNGVIITDDGNDSLISFIRNSGRDMGVVHLAMLKHPQLHKIAELAAMSTAVDQIDPNGIKSAEDFENQDEVQTLINKITEV